MDFTLTDEQRLLSRTARDVLAEAEPDPDRQWKQLVHVGWLDADLGPVELGLLAEEVGRAGYTGPWPTTAGLAAPLLRAAGEPVDTPATLAWSEPATGPRRLPDPAATLICRVDPAGRLTGVKTGVPHLAEATMLVVAADGPQGTELHLVDSSTVDTSGAELRLEATPARRIVGADRAAGLLRAARIRMLALLAGQAVGVADRALELAVEYATVRTQFGRPIGVNQAVAHPLAERYADVQLARSLAYQAAWYVRADAEQPGEGRAVEAVLAATIAARQAALDCCETAIQVHGATGFTWEHPLRLHYQTARWIAGFDGYPGTHRAELAALLLDRTAD